MKQKIIDKILLKYFLVGIVNTVVGQGITFLLINFAHLGLWLSTAIGYTAGSIVSFFGNKLFTFKKKQRSIKEVFIYIANIVVCYFIAYGVAEPLVERLASTSSSEIVKDNLAALVGLVIFIVLNYFGQRFVVFKERNNNEQ